MSTTTEQLKKNMKSSVELLQTLRDEIRVQIHLGGMDVKAEWQTLEPEVEEAINDAAHDADAMVQGLVGKLNALRKKLEGRAHS